VAAISRLVRLYNSAIVALLSRCSRPPAHVPIAGLVNNVDFPKARQDWRREHPGWVSPRAERNGERNGREDG
jgi:hypothetical protein